jgi:hypothetical protein
MTNPVTRVALTFLFPAATMENHFRGARCLKEKDS